MEDAHTPAGYFIAIVAVLGGAMLMPPFPVFVVVVGPALLLGILAYGLLRAKRDKANKERFPHSTRTPARSVPTMDGNQFLTVK